MFNVKRRAARRGWLLGAFFALVVLVAPSLMPGNMALGPRVYPIIKGLMYPATLIAEGLPGDLGGNAHAGPSLFGLAVYFVVHFAFYGCVGAVIACVWVWYRDRRLPEEDRRERDAQHAGGADEPGGHRAGPAQAGLWYHRQQRHMQPHGAHDVLHRVPVH